MTRECAIEIASKTGLALEEAKKLIDDLERNISAEKNSDAYDRALIEARGKQETAMAAQIIRDKRDAVINTIRKGANDSKVARLTEAGLSKFDSLAAMFGGIISHVPETRDSIGLHMEENHSKFLGAMVANIEQEGLIKIFSDKNLQLDHARYLEYLNTKNKGAVKEPAVSQQSKRIAQIIKDNFDKINADINRSGGFVGELDKFAGNVTHNAKRILKVGFEKWYTDTVPLVDRAALFRNLSAQIDSIGGLAHTDIKIGDFRNNTDGNLRNVFQFMYDRFSAGDHYYDVSSTDLGNKISASRLIPFKDAESYINYNRAYGEGDWASSVTRSVEIKARQLSLLESLGTNPRKEFNRLLADTKTGEISRDEARKLNNIYGNIDGSINNPMNPSIAEISTAIRVWNGPAGLGKALFAHLATDPLSRFIEQKRIGVSTSKALGNQVREVFNFVTGGKFESDAERDLIQTAYGIGNEGLVGRLLNQSADGVPGFGTKMMRLEMKLNGEQYWIDRGRRTSAAVMSGMLGSLRETAFEKLPSTMKTMMQRYNIDSGKWDILRSLAEKQEDGRYHIMPDIVEGIDDVTFQAMHPDLSDRQMRQSRKELADTLRGFVIDRASHFANMSPDAVDRSIALQGTNPGTYLGLAMRLVAQFKQFPIAATRKIWGESLYGQEKKDWNQVASIIAGSFITGYGAYASRQFLEGKTPEIDGKAAMEAFVKASGGIYGDMLINSITHVGDGEGWIKGILGPTVGHAIDIYKIIGKAYKTGNIDNHEFKQLMGMTPYNNIFWLRPMLDYAVINDLQERIRPGYLNRVHNQMVKYGQSPIMTLPVAISNRSLQGDMQ